MDSVSAMTAGAAGRRPADGCVAAGPTRVATSRGCVAPNSFTLRPTLVQLSERRYRIGSPTLMAARSVLQVFEPLEGGVPEHVVQLAAGLPAHEVNVEVAAPADTPFLARLDEARVRVHVLPVDRSDRLSDVRTALALRKVDADRNPTIVHAHSSKAGALVRAALRVAAGWSTARTASRSSAAFGASSGTPTTRPRTSLGRTGAVIATSDWERDQVRRHLRGASAKTRVIKYGVPACNGEAPLEELLRFKERYSLAGLISRLEPQKDPLALVAAAAPCGRRA